MMKTIKKRSFYLLLVGLVILLGSVVTNLAMARGGHGPGGGMPLKMLWDLDLTAEQKAAVGQLLPAYREEGEALKAKMHAARERMHALMTADVLDEDGIREAARAMAPIMEEMAVMRAHLMFDLKDILSPEQIRQIEEKRRGASERREKQRRFRRDMMETWLQMPVGGEAKAE